MKCPYIKPTRRIHDSGFRVFEVGYCEEKDGKTIEKKVLGNCSDHIWIRGMEILGDKSLESIHMDLTKDGYIRFFIWDEGKSKGCKLLWDEPCYSDAILKLVDKEVTCQISPEA